MIIDTLDKIGRYAALSEGFARAAGFLITTDLYALPCGRTEIDGERVYVIKSQTKLSRDSMAWEAHARYADVQVILGGRERFGWGVQERFGNYDAPGDFLPCVNVRGFDFALTERQFAIFFPQEPHAPGNYVEKGDVSTKIIVKALMQ